jgi:hypothetical protein
MKVDLSRKTSLPLVGRVGVGVAPALEMNQDFLSFSTSCATPTLDPSPQGGGKTKSDSIISFHDRSKTHTSHKRP